jgi:hypothetical protein
VAVGQFSPLAPSAELRHNSTMPKNQPEDHPFTMSVEPYPGRSGQYGWVVFRDGHKCDASQGSYSTKQEAQDAGEMRVDRLVFNCRKTQ